MRKYQKQQGFSLLEVMLALVIVAFVLVMATRYYQNARTNSQIDAGIDVVNQLTAAATSFEQGNPAGGYTGVGFSNKAFTAYLPYNAQNQADFDKLLPWGSGTADVTVGKSPASVTISLTGIPDAVCQGLAGKLATSGESPPTCDSGTFSISYN